MGHKPGVLPVLAATVLALTWQTRLAPAEPVSVSASTTQVGRYERIDFRLEFSGTYTNPFSPDEIEASLKLAGPGGVTLTIPGFWFQDYDRRQLQARGGARDWLYPRGKPCWQARFAPMASGKYSAVAVVKDAGGTRTSAPVEFACGSSGNRGFVRVSGSDPRFLEFSQGQAFFPIGQNVAFVGGQQYVTLSKAEEIFRRLAENGANYVRLWTCGDDWATAIEARKSAWGRSWDWHPPIASRPVPDSALSCLQLPQNGLSLSVDPSHPVALRPETRYVFIGRLRSDHGARVRVEGVRLGQQSWNVEPEQGWQAFRCEFQTGPADYWLGGLKLSAESEGTVWLGDLSLREAGDGPELLWETDVNRPVRGFYNPLDCFVVDQLVESAGKQGVYLQLCLLTRDLYLGQLKNPGDRGYDEAIQDAKHLLRYAVARWGYSTSVAAWEYWNEMDPSLPTDRFYAQLGEWLERNDPYGHLRTTSTWGPSARDCRHPELDLADTHFYLRPSDSGRLADEVEAVIDRTRWLRAQAPRKPVHLGEFGIADEKWGLRQEMKGSPELADVHNALWASALSGAAGTAMSWWWERLDQRDVYPIYRPLSRFLADVPWNGGELTPVAATCSDSRVRLLGLQTRVRAWFWLFNPEASWQRLAVDKRAPAPIVGATVTLTGLKARVHRVRWVDPWRGTVRAESLLELTEGSRLLPVPEFDRDIAGEVLP